jgi:hypothetical protein
MVFGTYATSLNAYVEHIRYPENKSTNGGAAIAKSRTSDVGRQASLRNVQAGSNPNIASPSQGSGILTGRGTPDVGDIAEDPRRIASPIPNGNGRANIKPTNGVAQQPFPNAKKPPRPQRSQESGLGHEEDTGTESDAPPRAPSVARDRVDSAARERAMSPDQSMARAKSPSVRAMSPAPQNEAKLETIAPQQQPLASIQARSASPSVGPRSSPLANATIPEASRSRDADIDVMKKRETWMKAALAKARQAGFIYNDEDLADDNLPNSGRMTPAGQRVPDALVTYKQLRAQLQVCSTLHPVHSPLIALSDDRS